MTASTLPRNSTWCRGCNDPGGLGDPGSSVPATVVVDGIPMCADCADADTLVMAAELDAAGDPPDRDCTCGHPDCGAC